MLSCEDFLLKKEKGLKKILIVLLISLTPNIANNLLENQELGCTIPFFQKDNKICRRTQYPDLP